MKESSREKILRKIKTALDENPVRSSTSIEKSNSDYFPELGDSLELTFARELQKINGKFVYCIDEDDLVENLKQIVEEEKWEAVFCINDELKDILLDAEIPFMGSADDFHQMEVAITSCEFLIARFGSVMVSSAQISGRQLNVYPPVHIIIAKSSQMVAEISDAITKIQEKYRKQLPSMISLISGPSRTADIEKTLILGAHGPKELYVFLVNDQV